MKKNKGESYTTSKGQNIQSKKIKPGCTRNCPLKCCENVTLEERENIFKSYWGSGSFDTQRNYIAQNVLSVPPKKVGSNNRRERKPRAYFLTLENKRVQVCRTFFLNTLSVTEKTVNCTIKKKIKSAIPLSDGRGKGFSGNEVGTPELDKVRKHIEKFPCVESHYCRQSTKRKYLASHLSVKKMYEMYKSECKEKAKSLTMYRKVFNTDYNLGSQTQKGPMQTVYCVRQSNKRRKSKGTRCSRFAPLQ